MEVLVFLTQRTNILSEAAFASENIMRPDRMPTVNIIIT
jgi:hypothetical protein